MFLFFVAFLVVLADQLTKFFVVRFMEVGQSISLIGNFFAITYVRNPGAAFGIFPYQTLFFIVITLLVAILIIYYYRFLAKDHTLFRLALALQLGGAIGNLIDRVRGGYVIDFLDFSIFPPIFNLADSAIVIGVGLFLIAFLRDPELRGIRS